MSTVCGAISAGIAVDCDYPLQAGTEDTLILINRADIASLTRNGSNPEIIEDIILVSGALGYVYEGMNNSHSPKANMVKVGKYRRWSHQIDFMAFGVYAEDKEQIQKLKDGDIVAVVYNKFKGSLGKGAFEMYGYDAGLKSETIDRDVMSQDSQGAFQISLMSDKDTGLEPHLPKTIWVTGYAQTLAVVEALHA